MLPWAEMWRAALRVGVGPEVFWRLSVREWRWLSGTDRDGLGRTKLAELMEIFPDE